MKVFAPPWILCPSCLTSNRIDEYHDLLEKTDFAATDAQGSQRLGRVGRVKRGAYISVEATRRIRLVPSLCCNDALCRVQALSKKQERVSLELAAVSCVSVIN